MKFAGTNQITLISFNHVAIKGQIMSIAHIWVSLTRALSLHMRLVVLLLTYLHTMRARDHMHKHRVRWNIRAYVFLNMSKKTYAQKMFTSAIFGPTGLKKIIGTQETVIWN